MSFDLQLAHPCTHRAEEEKVSLSEDRLTLTTVQPVASANTLVLYANDLVIPRGGLYSSAILKSRIAGAFFIPKYENKLIISSTEDHIEIDLPVSSLSSRLTTDHLVSLIREKAKSVFAENDNGHLVLTDLSTVGTGSVVQVSEKARYHIGFGRQNIMRGRQIYPSWDLYAPPNLVNQFDNISLYRGIKFHSPIKSNPFFRMSYGTYRGKCLRCGSANVENDYRFGSNGNLLVIENENLLYQGAVKMLLADKGSNPFFKAYGTNLRARIGSKAVGYVSQSISQEVRSALARFQGYQSDQAKYQGMSLRERLYSIISVEVFQREDDPTTFLIDVVVQSATSQSIQLDVVFTTPSTVGRLVQDGIPLSQIGSI